jgi:hypothetical protein
MLLSKIHIVKQIGICLEVQFLMRDNISIADHSGRAV